MKYRFIVIWYESYYGMNNIEEAKKLAENDEYIVIDVVTGCDLATGEVIPEISELKN